MPQTQVYPRWRGEHCMALASSLTDAGLSPLARGTHISEQKTKPQPRFIPAGAGNTYKTRTHPPRGAVYPRWRGLSPLARGTRRDYSKEDAGDRFIPAGAGNTGSVCGSIAGGAGNTVDGEFFIAGAPVYPRWRGEHDRLRHLAVADQGLSPLARGTQNLLQNSL